MHAPGRGAYVAELHRVIDLLGRSEPHARWWASTGFGQFLLRVDLADPRWRETPGRAGSRKVGENLRWTISCAIDDLPERAAVDELKLRARHDVELALQELARRRRLPPPPQLPDLHLNARARRNLAEAAERAAQDALSAAGPTVP